MGIGTSNPTSALGINGNITFTNAADRTITVGASSGPTAGRSLTIMAGVNGFGTGGGGLYLSGTDTPGGLGGNVYMYGGNGYTGYGNTYLAYNGSSASGKVGIGGATNSSTLLAVTGSSYFSDNVGIATSTPQYSLTIASTTAPQLALSAGAGLAQWTFRNAGGNLYLSTTTVAGTATTTTSALSISGTGFGTTTLSGLTISGQATSTSNVGFNITTGCFAINGTCVGGGSASLTGTTGQIAYFDGVNSAIGTSTLYISTAGKD